MASLNQDILGRIRLPLASIEVQRRVVAVLSGYDDLVETNLQRIKVLEDMAAAIYSEWIVNSQVGAQNPPTNSADTHWELVKVSEVADAGRGLSWRREQETEDEASPGIVTIPNVGSRLNPVPRKRLADVSPKDLETYQLHESDILMIGSNGNPERVGQTVRVPTNVELLFASFLMRIRPKPGTAKALLFHQLTDRKFKEALQSGAVGSTGLRNIRITALRDAELMMPPRDLRQRFENAVGPIHRLIDTLAEESLTLARARERLLPRLISGEIDVSELDIDTSWLAA